MKTTATRYAVTAALFGALGFTAATCPFAQTRTAAAASIQAAQFCVPQEPTYDAHRFYCRNERTPVSLPEEALADIGSYLAADLG